jgi:hypothetical protein
MNKVSRIESYDTIYGVVLIVANQYATIEEIREIVEYLDGSEMDDGVMDNCANVTICKRKSDGKDCVFVKYNCDCGYASNKKVDFINTVSHEAGHVALRIYEHMDQNVCFCSSEPFCYLLGWAAECIYKTIKGA